MIKARKFTALLRETLTGYQDSLDQLDALIKILDTIDPLAMFDLTFEHGIEIIFSDGSAMRIYGLQPIVH